MKNILLILILFSLTACGTAQKVQYSAMEKVGIHKRDILVDRIEKTSKLQEQTKQEFKSAYEELTALVSVDDRGLEAKYKKLATAVKNSEDSTDQLKDRIASVDQVAAALFDEWKQELDEYSNPKLRKISDTNMRSTKQRYAMIYRQMQDSFAKIEPVLQVLQDNTLYLKHNLNARAINGITNEVMSVGGKVAELIKQMEASIAESKKFIDGMSNK